MCEKVLYEQESRGIPEYGVHKFVKPFFFATMLVLGVSLSLPVFFLMSAWGVEGYLHPSGVTRPSIFEFILPGFFGLFQGVMSSITSALIGVSIDYMMRSATLIGVSLIAKFYFNRVFEVHEWTGMLLVAFSLALVGLSSIISAGTSLTILVPRKWVFVILVFKALSQVAYSVKLSIEQYYTQQRKVHPMAVTGFESFWAFVIGAFVLLPIVNMAPGVEGKGLHEDMRDTLAQLRNNSFVVLVLCVAASLECVYSISSVALTQATSAVLRTLVESFRTFLIWVLQLALFYILRDSPTLARYKGIGEEWSTGTYLQLVGYCILIVGLTTYRGLVCCGSHTKERKDREGFELLESGDMSL
jgi:hypothetical protein